MKISRFGKLNRKRSRGLKGRMIMRVMSKVMDREKARWGLSEARLNSQIKR